MSPAQCIVPKSNTDESPLNIVNFEIENEKNYLYGIPFVFGPNIHSQYYKVINVVFTAVFFSYLFFVCLFVYNL